MDILSPPKACDPWAVYAAKSSMQGTDRFSALTASQKRIVDFIKRKGEATTEEIINEVGITEAEALRRKFATLRHMEVLRGAKKESGAIVYVAF